MISFQESIYYLLKHAIKVDKSPFNSFLELGATKGSVSNNLADIFNLVESVDIVPEATTSTKIKFYNMTTDEYFKQNTNTFDSIFIDADHEYNQVLKDFRNSLNILNSGGIIFLHDTDPVEESFTRPNLCGDSWKVIDIIEEEYDLDLITLPIAYPGLTIVQRKLDRRVYQWQK